MFLLLIPCCRGEAGHLLHTNYYLTSASPGTINYMYMHCCAVNASLPIECVKILIKCNLLLIISMINAFVYCCSEYTFAVNGFDLALDWLFKTSYID